MLSGRLLGYSVIALTAGVILGIVILVSQSARTAPPNSDAEESIVLLNTTQRINKGESIQFSSFSPPQAQIKVIMKVEKGGPVDVLLFDSAGYAGFKDSIEGNRSRISFIETGSALNVTLKTYTFLIPAQDRYYIVISNSGHIEGGARPSGDVDVYLKVTSSFS